MLTLLLILAAYLSPRAQAVELSKLVVHSRHELLSFHLPKDQPLRLVVLHKSVEGVLTSGRISCHSYEQCQEILNRVWDEVERKKEVTLIGDFQPVALFGP